MLNSITVFHKYYIQSYKDLSKDIWLLSLVMFVNRSGAMVLPFLSIYLNLEKGLSFSQCGIIMAFFGLGSVSGALIGGWLTDLIGYYRVMLISLLLSSASFLMVMNLNSFASLCFGFFAISLIADMFRPANLTAIEAFSKPQNLTRSIGLIRLAINLGYAFGPFLGGYVASILGYNFLFIFNAISTCSAGIIFYSFFKNKKKKIEKHDDTDEVIIKKQPWHDIPYLAYLSLWFVIATVFLLFIYVVPLYYKSGLGFDESLVGLVMGLNGLIIFLIEMPLIFFLERYFRPVSLIVIGGILIGISFFAFPIFPHALTAALVFTLVITIGEILSFPFSNTYAMTFSNERNRGKYMGFYTVTFSLAHVVAPILWFKIVDINGFEWIWYTGGIACVVASLMIIWTKVASS